MANSTMEIDFFRGETTRAPSPSFLSPDLGPSAFSGIQKVVSRINPNLLKTAMASSRPKNSNRTPISKSPSESAPLTIFYNGTVAAFHLPRDKAEAIIGMAEKAANDYQKPGKSPLDGDLPIARKKSLKRFLEKRRERCRGPAMAESPLPLS